MYDPLKAKAKVVFYSAIAFLFGVGMASGLGWTSTSHAMPSVTESPQVSTAEVQPALDLSEAFTNLAEAVTPAVVRIESRRPGQAVSPTGQVPEAFRRFFPDQGDLGEPAPRVASGSGFIVSEDGYILTNNHVVEGADEVTVYFPDRRYFTARIVGADPFTDVAVIKIDAGGSLPHMSFGNSDDLKVGEWILAIGNPGFGNSAQLDFTVTAGIISARGRGLQLLQQDLLQDPRYGDVASRYAIEDFIQTDAVINPGNSGGPMVNLRGQVVGINSAIASSTGVYQGYGFAIPINLARRVMEDLIEFGTVQRPRMGVSIQNVTAEDAEVYSLPAVSGVLVQTVEDETPAAGVLEPEDVIVAIDGEPVGYVAELQAKIAERHPGDRIDVTVYRDGRRMDLSVRLAEAPINGPRTVAEAPVVHSEDRLGINLQELDAELAEQLGFNAPGGVVLQDVAPGSAAQRRNVGAFVRNKLIRVNDTVIRTRDDVARALDGVAPGEIVTLHFQDASGDERVVNLRMP
ncbi:MAG: trypsin-like peptidase domain-containing protein [Gemmatimonadales bacterium]